jgi:response regulator RpfG family c-di-GMP phosphodiesterase
MAPEQARDASMVDIRADIYGLGGTLFYALTGRLPFGEVGSPAEVLARRLISKPPSLSAHLPKCPDDLERLVARMMALEPADRFQTPQEVMQGLLPFIRVESREYGSWPNLALGHLSAAQPASSVAAKASPRVLVVDDEQSARDYARHVLALHEVQCDLVESGEEALEAIALKDYDLILLDLLMPGIHGRDVLQRIRSDAKFNNVKVILLSGHATADEMALLLNEGADDFLNKPFSVMQFQGRVRSALRLKAAQDRSGQLNQELAATNMNLEQSLHASSLDLAATRRAVVLGLSHLVELRDARSARHLIRMQRYCRAIAESARNMPEFKDRIDSEFISMLECCVPLHDIGKVGLPDHILMKSGVLTPEERMLMETHTAFAADTWHQVARDYPGARAFLDMTIDVIRHHHERFDGTGYPDKLAGEAIPLAARIASICDVYDALRSRKSHRPPLSHPSAMKIIATGSPGQFDPALLQAFQIVAQDFHAIFLDNPN